jgi:dTDP-4-amino-4,6-dideoxygalactose transaminase
MTEIEAAIGLIQLGKLEKWTEARRANAATYAERLDPALGLPVERTDAVHVYHQYTLAPQDRDHVREALREAGIGNDVYYPTPAHLQDPYVGPTYDLPVSEEMARRVLSIPVRPDLTEAEIDMIVSTLNGLA